MLPMPLNFGLCHRVTLERSSNAKDAIGGTVQSFAAVAGAVGVRAMVFKKKDGQRTQDFSRKGWIEKVEVITAQDLGARPGDRVHWLDENVFLEVTGAHPFKHGEISDELVYVIDCLERTA
jgi:hypothetical protein